MTLKMDWGKNMSMNSIHAPNQLQFFGRRAVDALNQPLKQSLVQSLDKAVQSMTELRGRSWYLTGHLNG